MEIEEQDGEDISQLSLADSYFTKKKSVYTDTTMCNQSF